VDGTALHADTVSAGSLYATNLTLRPLSQPRGAPAGYAWPAAARDGPPPGVRRRPHIAPWEAALIAVACCTVALAAAGGAAIWALRRRHARRAARSPRGAAPAALASGAAAAVAAAGAGSGEIGVAPVGAALTDLNGMPAGAEARPSYRGSACVQVVQDKPLPAEVLSLLDAEAMQNLAAAAAAAMAAASQLQPQPGTPSLPAPQPPQHHQSEGGATSSSGASWARVQTGIREMQGRILDRRSAPRAAQLHAAAAAGEPPGLLDCAGDGSDSGARPPGPPATGLQLLEVIGRGSFATVYRAVWRGRYVAAKVILLSPAGAAARGGEVSGARGNSSGDGDGGSSLGDGHERTAIMEAVVSSMVSHPNILPVSLARRARAGPGRPKCAPPHKLRLLWMPWGSFSLEPE
jgi:hypothetical protein